MEVFSFEFGKVNQFSARDKSYTLDTQKFSDFINYDFDYEQFEKVIANRSKQIVDRTLLVDVLQSQYDNLVSSAQTIKNIDALLDENTYTITTAHQPSLLTGPLYYIFKICSTIRLTERLKKDFPEQDFVPLFILGAEDHDFDEINHLSLYGKTISWQNSDASGAVGRLSLDGIAEVIDQVLSILGNTSEAQNLLNNLKNRIPKLQNYAQFSFELTHALFDTYGLVILRMDDRRLKKAFAHITQEEILNSSSQALIQVQQEKIEALGYKAQAHAREINFFYLRDGNRSRIVKIDDNTFEVLDTTYRFTTEQIIKEINEFPERFSPNVVMRPIYQEFVLPNLAYIGGGGEIAYWLERKTQFKHFGVTFPMLIRRSSAMILSQQDLKTWQKLGFEMMDLLEDENQLIDIYLKNADTPDYALDSYKAAIESQFDNMSLHIKEIDPTIEKTAQSELAKVLKGIDHLEARLKRAIKHDVDVQLKRIHKVKDKYFSSGLQERFDNILPYYAKFGKSLIDQIIKEADPFDKDFKILLL